MSRCGRVSAPQAKTAHATIVPGDFPEAVLALRTAAVFRFGWGAGAATGAYRRRGNVSGRAVEKYPSAAFPSSLAIRRTEKGTTHGSGFRGPCVRAFLNSPLHAPAGVFQLLLWKPPVAPPRTSVGERGLPGARIAAFSGHPAVAAQRPQSHLSEQRPVRVMTLQRCETLQRGRISNLPPYASEREGSPSPWHANFIPWNVGR